MKLIHRHSEWVVFFIGLLLMATMNPYVDGTSLCLFETLGLKYCPGEGLGHSIAFLFRGEYKAALEANLMGPLVVVGLSTRIITIWKNLIQKQKMDLQENYNV